MNETDSRDQHVQSEDDFSHADVEQLMLLDVDKRRLSRDSHTTDEDVYVNNETGVPLKKSRSMRNRFFPKISKKKKTYTVIEPIPVLDNDCPAYLLSINANEASEVLVLADNGNNQMMVKSEGNSLLNSSTRDESADEGRTESSEKIGTNSLDRKYHTRRGSKNDKECKIM